MQRHKEQSKNIGDPKKLMLGKLFTRVRGTLPTRFCSLVGCRLASRGSLKALKVEKVWLFVEKPNKERILTFNQAIRG